MAVLNLETATTFWQSRKQKKQKMAVTKDGEGAEQPRLLMVGVLLLPGPTKPLPDLTENGEGAERTGLSRRDEI